MWTFSLIHFKRETHFSLSFFCAGNHWKTENVIKDALSLSAGRHNTNKEKTGPRKGIDIHWFSLGLHVSKR